MKVEINEIGKRLSFFRKEKGYSQQTIADKADISRSYIAHVENGKQNPSFEFLIRIMEAFDLSLDWLLTGKGQMHLIPDDHVLNKLSEQQVELLKKLDSLPEDKKDNLLNIFFDIITAQS